MQFGTGVLVSFVAYGPLISYRAISMRRYRLVVVKVSAIFLGIATADC